MQTRRHPEFRLGTTLATGFTATLSERYGRPVERIPVPQRLMDWLAIHDLEVDACSAEELESAQELREGIHAVATAVARSQVLPGDSLAIINRCGMQGTAAPTLLPNGSRLWVLESRSVTNALSVVAADAIDILSGERDGKVALCASETCRAGFFDTSRSRTRRWCDMNSCGNKEKKARFLANRLEKSTSGIT